MDLLAKIYITAKGVEEVERRAHKLSIRKRSVLVQLNKPQSIEHIIDKSVFHQDEIFYEINALVQDGFITMGGGEAPAPSASLPAPEDIFYLDDEIVLSKARFLLIDFCVDSFGTQSETYVDAIRTCKSARSLSQSLRHIFAAAEKQCPGEIPTLLKVIKQINDTA